MGIRVDWEVEDERAKTRTMGEDPDAKKFRGRAFRRLLLTLLILFALGACVIGVVIWRLDEVDKQIRESLISTVENEVAALRIGDRNTFTSIQRSENAAWLQIQQQLYDAYQQIKVDANVILSGRVLDVVIDGARARVQVEEIIDGVPYARTWFYFRYDDGWRHVPADYTFWGTAQTFSSDSLRVSYFSYDQPFADAVNGTVSRWLQMGCAILLCPETADVLAIEIVPDETIIPGWADDSGGRMLLPSPFTGAARLDSVFAPEVQLQSAALVAERLVALAQPNAPQPNADAAYLRQAIISWLVKRLTGQETNAFSIDSLAQVYGESVVGRLLSSLTPEATMAVLASAVGVSSLGEMPLDWRDLLTWRLTLETRLIAERSDAAFLALYDTSDVFAQNLAFQRYAAGNLGEIWIVTSAVREMNANGLPLLRATALVRAPGGDRTVEVLFRLVDGVWKRAS